MHGRSRRIGCVCHMQTAPGACLPKKVDMRLAQLDAVASCPVDTAVAAADPLIEFVHGRLDVLEGAVDPMLPDCSRVHFDGAQP